ncbi:MAG: response regulator, partial [Myxococcales bacterium]
HGGTGLGLAISKAIVELLGGELAVESVAGHGSTFSFSLRAPTEVRPVSRPSLPHERVVRALLLDASPGSRAAVASQLEAQGVVVQACASGAEFFAALGALEAPDVLVVDPRAATHGPLELLQQLSSERQLPPVIMLYPRGAADRAQVEGYFASHLRQPGCAALAKPVRPRHLLQAFAAAVHRQTAGRPASTRSALESEPRRRLRVLVAEDNAVNQRVVRTMLVKLGHEATVVDNGQLALDATQRANFDVILLDVHMPVLDGLEASRRLNAALPRSRRPRIIGLTASALPGDREACLAAGMDVFLPKPIQLPDLVRALADAGAVAPSVPSLADSDRASMDVIDPHIVDQLRFRLPPAALHEHVERAIEHGAAAALRIEQAFAARDLASVEAECAGLRERCASLGLVRLYALLIKIERGARERHPELLPPSLSRLATECERAWLALRRLGPASPTTPGSGVRAASRADESGPRSAPISGSG